MKLWLQIPMKFDPAFRTFFEAGFHVKRSDTEISIQLLESGIHALDQFGYEAIRFFNDRLIVKNLMKATNQGFDAVIIGCFFDPGLQAAKQLLDIPVFGIAENSMHFAAIASSKFAIITSYEPYIPGIEELIKRYGMEKRVIARSPVRAVTVSPDVYEECLLTGNYEPIIEDFRIIAKGCIEDGSELIIAGCGALAPILTKQELFSIEHVPVINPFLITIKIAEASVDLFQKAHIPAVSRHGSSRLIPKALHERLSEMF